MPFSIVYFVAACNRKVEALKSAVATEQKMLFDVRNKYEEVQRRLRSEKVRQTPSANMLLR